MVGVQGSHRPVAVVRARPLAQPGPGAGAVLRLVPGPGGAVRLRGAGGFERFSGPGEVLCFRAAAARRGRIGTAAARSALRERVPYRFRGHIVVRRARGPVRSLFDLFLTGGHILPRGRLQPLQRRVDEGLAGVEALHVVGDDLAPLPAPPVVGGVADGGEQVGAEGVLRAPAAPDEAEHAGERLGYGVLRLRLAAQQVPGQTPGRRRVAFVEGGVGAGVTAAHPPDQLHVTDQSLCVIAGDVAHPASFLGSAPRSAEGSRSGAGRTRVSEKYPASASQPPPISVIRDEG